MLPLTRSLLCVLFLIYFVTASTRSYSDANDEDEIGDDDTGIDEFLDEAISLLPVEVPFTSSLVFPSAQTVGIETILQGLNITGDSGIIDSGALSVTYGHCNSKSRCLFELKCHSRISHFEHDGASAFYLFPRGAPHVALASEGVPATESCKTEDGKCILLNRLCNNIRSDILELTSSEERAQESSIPFVELHGTLPLHEASMTFMSEVVPDEIDDVAEEGNKGERDLVVRLVSLEDGGHYYRVKGAPNSYLDFDIGKDNLLALQRMSCPVEGKNKGNKHKDTKFAPPEKTFLWETSFSDHIDKRILLSIVLPTKAKLPYVRTALTWLALGFSPESSGESSSAEPADEATASYFMKNQGRLGRFDEIIKGLEDQSRQLEDEISKLPKASEGRNVAKGSDKTETSNLVPPPKPKRTYTTYTVGAAAEGLYDIDSASNHAKFSHRDSEGRPMLSEIKCASRVTYGGYESASYYFPDGYPLTGLCDPTKTLNSCLLPNASAELAQIICPRMVELVDEIVEKRAEEKTPEGLNKTEVRKETDHPFFETHNLKEMGREIDITFITKELPRNGDFTFGSTPQTARNLTVKLVRAAEEVKYRVQDLADRSADFKIDDGRLTLRTLICPKEEKVTAKKPNRSRLQSAISKLPKFLRKKQDTTQTSSVEMFADETRSFPAKWPDLPTLSGVDSATVTLSPSATYDHVVGALKWLLLGMVNHATTNTPKDQTIAKSSTSQRDEEQRPIPPPRKNKENDQARVDSVRHRRDPPPRPNAGDVEGNGAVRKAPAKPPRSFISGQSAESGSLSGAGKETTQMKTMKKRAPAVPDDRYKDFKSLLAEGETNILDSAKAITTGAGDIGSIANEHNMIVSDEGKIIFQPSHEGETLMITEMKCPTRDRYKLPSFPHPEHSYYIFPEGLSKFRLSFGMFKSATRDDTYEIKTSSRLEDSLKILYMGLSWDRAVPAKAVHAPALRAARITDRLCHFVQSDVEALVKNDKDKVEGGVKMLKSDDNEAIPFAELHGTEPLKDSPIKFTFISSTAPNLNSPIIVDDKVLQLNVNDLKVTQVGRAFYEVQSEDFKVRFEAHAKYFRLKEMKCPGRWYSDKLDSPTDFVFKEGLSDFLVKFQGSDLLGEVTKATFDLPDATEAEVALKWLLRVISAEASSVLETMEGTNKSEFLMRSTTPEGFLIRNLCRQKGSSEHKKDTSSRPVSKVKSVLKRLLSGLSSSSSFNEDFGRAYKKVTHRDWEGSKSSASTREGDTPTVIALPSSVLTRMRTTVNRRRRHSSAEIFPKPSKKDRPFERVQSFGGFDKEESMEAEVPHTTDEDWEHAFDTSRQASENNVGPGNLLTLAGSKSPLPPDIAEFDPLQGKTDGDQNGLTAHEESGYSAQSTGDSILNTAIIDSDTTVTSSGSGSHTSNAPKRHESQTAQPPFDQLLVKDEYNMLKNDVFGRPNLIGGEGERLVYPEPTWTTHTGNFMIEFFTPSWSQGQLAIRQLSCKARLDYHNDHFAGYVFPKGLHRFNMRFPGFPGAPKEHRLYGIQHTGLLSDSVRLLYIGTAEPVEGPPQDVRASATLLYPITVALCKMIQDDITAHEQDGDYRILKDVPYIEAHKSITGDGGAEITLVSKALPGPDDFPNKVDSSVPEPETLKVEVKKRKKGNSVYTVKDKGSFISFVSEKDRLRFNAMSCPGKLLASKISYEKLETKPAYISAQWRRTFLKDYNVLPFVMKESASDEEVISALRWVYSGLPFPHSGTGYIPGSKRKPPPKSSANKLFVKILCSNPPGKSGEKKKSKGSKIKKEKLQKEKKGDKKEKKPRDAQGGGKGFMKGLFTRKKTAS
ncbi:hypothetical protein FOL47_011244 [Perkinsus chesapeaki]|uniref:Transmembrane protein n=1 Tax=Perkinsus chesapeaki TaxID=330153 RepID=A0A7J6MMT7_PERCH|nr:hypothetical protein FOL47_011244 [Perkinsus chesapeaki]